MVSFTYASCGTSLYINYMSADSGTTITLTGTGNHCPHCGYSLSNHPYEYPAFSGAVSQAFNDLDWRSDFPARVAWFLWGKPPPFRPNAYAAFIRPAKQAARPRCRSPPCGFLRGEFQ